MTFGLGGNLGVKVGGAYGQKGFALTEQGVDGTFALDYIEIPVLLRLGIPTSGSLSPRFFLGPAVSIEAGCSLEASSGGVSVSADCTEGESVPAAGSGFEARLRLEREDGRQADTLAAGETLVLVLTLRNPADSPLRLSLPTAQTHDFSITTDDGRELWRWSAGRRFAQVLTELELAPGEERSFRGAWSQRSADGSPAPPGG